MKTVDFVHPLTKKFCSASGVDEVISMKNFLIFLALKKFPRVEQGCVLVQSQLFCYLLKLMIADMKVKANLIQVFVIVQFLPGVGGD